MCKTTERRNAIRKIEDELIKREMKNLGRWCKITMKRTGKTLIINRLGYGPMEYPEKDPHNILDENHDVIADGFETLWDVANWIYEHR